MSRRYSALQRRDTGPEMRLRRALYRLGYRYRVNVQVPGMARRSIDIAFTRRRVAVFVDGCFWHGCPIHAVAPKRNAEWWQWKLNGNRARDVSTKTHLEGQGWTVVRVWEHEPPDVALARVRAALDGGM